MRHPHSIWGYGGLARTVLTPHGKETSQVFLQRTRSGWVARIVTLPSRIWVQSGGREAMKFYGATATEAEAAAGEFMDQERIASGRRLLNERSAEAMPSLVRGTLESAMPRVASRVAQRFLLRFGVARPDRAGVTGNISETGLFIITDRPSLVGCEIEIDLRLPDLPIVLDGEVVWIRPERNDSASVGCGVRLIRRPTDYLEKIRSLVAVYDVKRTG